MVDIPRELSQFLTRDLVFMTGGSGVVASFLVWIDRLPDKDTPPAYFILALGAAYGVGFALQELFSLFGVVTTRNVYRPSRILQRLYRRYNHSEWPDLSHTDDAATRTIASRSKDDSWRAYHQRIITHMMVGSTLTPCAFASAGLLFVTYLTPEQGDAAILKLAVASLALALVLWPLGWLKAMQMTEREVMLARAAGDDSHGPHTAVPIPGTAQLCEEREAGKDVTMNEVSLSQEPPRIRLIETRHWHEQGLFWLRFTAFAALQAGLFALVATTSPSSPRLLAWAGLALSLVWAVVHAFGVFYTHADKKDYRAICETYGAMRTAPGKLVRWAKPTHASSGAVVAVMGYWLYLLS